VCLAYGLAVSFGIYASAGVSGGHVNPAVTIAMAILGLGQNNFEILKI